MSKIGIAIQGLASCIDLHANSYYNSWHSTRLRESNIIYVYGTVLRQRRTRSTFLRTIQVRVKFLEFLWLRCY